MSVFFIGLGTQPLFTSCHIVSSVFASNDPQLFFCVLKEDMYKLIHIRLGYAVNVAALRSAFDKRRGLTPILGKKYRIALKFCVYERQQRCHEL